MARNTWVSVLKDEAGSVDPVGVFWSGARESGNNVSTQGGSFPLCLLEKGAEVANLVDSSLMEKRTERPLLSRANTGSSLAKDLGVLVLPSHTSNRPPPRGQKKVFRGSTVPHLKPTATAWSGRGGDEHVRVKRRRAVTAATLLHDACLGGEHAKRRLPCHG